MLYINSFLVCWLYSLKQWQISIEVPKQLNGSYDGLNLSKACYSRIKWIGIVVNVLTVLQVAYWRYELTVETALGTVSETTIHFAYDFTYGAICLGIVAGGFLIDAYRRLRKSFQDNHNLSENKCTMNMYIVALVLCQLVWLILNYDIAHAGPTNVVLLRMAFVISLVIS
jgi:hypothetical protein